MTNILKAIKFAKSEIKSLELAPKINGCEMTEWWKEQIEIWKTAISALEKQIPKKVNISLKGTTDWNTKCHGPNCHSMVSHGKYCSNCGQALDFNINGSDTDDK